MPGNGREVVIDDEISAYAALPQGASRGVVVIHEIFGRQPEMDRVVDRFADAGYAAVLPDLFGDLPRPVCIARMLRVELTGKGHYATIARRVRDWLCQRASLPPGAVGIIGFCIGGGFALAIGKGWGAVSVNYGSTPPLEVMRGSPPVIACYGGRDRAMAREPERLAKRLSALGVAHDIHVFPDSGHAFMTDGDHPIASFLTRRIFHARHDAVASEEAFARILAFFGQRLSGKGVPDDDRDT